MLDKGVGRGRQQGQGIVVPHQNDLGVGVQSLQLLQQGLDVGQGGGLALGANVGNAAAQQLQQGLALLGGDVQRVQVLPEGGKGGGIHLAEVALQHRQQGLKDLGAPHGSGNAVHDGHQHVIGTDLHRNDLSVLQLLAQVGQNKIYAGTLAGTGPHQLQQVAAHQGRHSVIGGLGPAQAQTIGYPGHIAILGVALVVAGNIVIPSVSLVNGVRQANAGYNAVAQSNVRIAVLIRFGSGIGLGLHRGGVCGGRLGGPGRNHRQHQQSQGQQQADNAFFHDVPPFFEP